MTMTNDNIAEEINRISRCIDFRGDRDLRVNAGKLIDALTLARTLITRPRPDDANLKPGCLDEAYVLTLKYADNVLEDLRRDVDCLNSDLRQARFDNLDDAQDTIRALIYIAQGLRD